MTSIKRPALGILFLAVLAAISASAQTPSPSNLVQQGDELYAQRADLAKAKEARSKYEAALAAKDDDYGANWRLARVLYWIGDHTPGNDAKKTIFQQGVEHAKKAVELGSDKADGHFWLGVCYGVYGEAKGVFKSLALVKPIKAEMRRVLEIDPAYDRGGADRVLGRVFHEVPGIAGGSEKTSLEHLLKAVGHGPRVGLNLLYLADTYISLDRIEDARKTLETILTLEPLPDLLPETAEEQAQARERLERKPFKKK
ncbi:MAG: TRAP transporter TatT component family protein [Acidobacteriota bacterium]